MYVAEYSKCLCHIMEVMGGPLTQALESRLERNKDNIQQLLRERAQLEEQLRELELEEVKVKTEEVKIKTEPVQ